MNFRILLIAIISLFLTCNFICKAQSRGDIRVMFYNTENIFDTEDDPATSDDDFTPTGKQHWTIKKYNQKLNHLYQAIAAVGMWQPPEIIGLCEVENRKVVTDLLYQTPLAKYRYSIVHFDSPDLRGIDVALLYRSDKAKVLNQHPVHVQFISNPQKKTRDILFVQLQMTTGDTICIFVNHWPSRRGGELESESLRIEVAAILRHSIDSLFRLNSMMKIIVMGDFNDDPTNFSIAQTLKAKTATTAPFGNQLYNLSFDLMRTSKTGTHYFQGHWQVIDQMIVSGGLLIPLNGLIANPQNSHICADDFLLQIDKRNIGSKPFPTYSGPRYIGGYSDHLPVYLDLFLKR